MIDPNGCAAIRVRNTVWLAARDAVAAGTR